MNGIDQPMFGSVEGKTGNILATHGAGRGWNWMEDLRVK
jgi:hypothetical protein